MWSLKDFNVKPFTISLDLMVVRCPVNYWMDLDRTSPIFDDSSFDLDARHCQTREVLKTYRVKPNATSPYLRVERHYGSSWTNLIRSTLKTSKLLLPWGFWRYPFWGWIFKLFWTSSALLASLNLLKSFGLRYFWENLLTHSLHSYPLWLLQHFH